jgi:bifunctional non-homologous end joining protein LigD
MRLKFVLPLMPTLVEKPPEGDGWIHEVKFDGYRSQIVIDDEGVRIFTRRGLDWTTKYRDLAKAAAELEVESAIIDGEIIVVNEAGLSDFAALRKAITRRQHDLYFVAFDLLHLNGRNLRDMALEERREILAGIIEPGGRIQFSEALPGDAKAIFKPIDDAGLEGMMSKRRDSKYRSGPSTNWLKAKCYAIGEFELLGVEREGRQAGLRPHGRARHRKIRRLCLHHLGTGRCGNAYGSASRNGQGLHRRNFASGRLRSGSSRG